jgi:hypothetical protein
VGRCVIPYKREGSAVLVKRGGKWVLLHRHATAAKAKRQLAALHIHATKGHR